MRLFVAVRPPPDACTALAGAAGRAADPRWHLTLAFLGDRPAAEPLLAPLAEAAARHPPFVLALTGGGTFGGRVLWAGVAGDLTPLAALAQDVREAVDAVEERPFHPHLTLARGHRLAVPARLRQHVGEPWPVTELELVLSRSSVHEVLHRLPLADP